MGYKHQYTACSTPERTSISSAREYSCLDYTSPNPDNTVWLAPNLSLKADYKHQYSKCSNPGPVTLYSASEYSCLDYDSHNPDDDFWLAPNLSINHLRLAGGNTSCATSNLFP